MIVNSTAAAPKTTFRRGVYAHELTNLRAAHDPKTIIDMHFAVGKGEINVKDGALAQVKSAKRHLADSNDTLKKLKEHLIIISRPNARSRGKSMLTGRDIQKIAEGSPTALANASFGVAMGKYDPHLVLGLIHNTGAHKEPARSPIHHFIKRTQEMIPKTRTQKFFDAIGNVLYKSVSWIIE